MTVFYAAVAAVEGGHVGEVEICSQTDTPDGSTVMISVFVRREVKAFVLPAEAAE